jgi:hypothetical protein
MSQKAAVRKKQTKTKPFKVQIVSRRGKLSAVEQNALDAFSEAVQKEYALLARKKVATVVLVNGEMIRGIPKKVNGRYVVTKS